MKKYSSFTNNLLLTFATTIILSGLVIKYQQQAFYYYDHKDNADTFAYKNENLQSDLKNNKTIQNNMGIDFSNITEQINSLKVDEKRVKSLKSFLTSRGSPLASKAKFLVQTADKFGLDYRLVAAISIIESSGGKFTYRPYNAWGWGGAVIPFSFDSWEDGIYTVSKGLSAYASSGLVTPVQIAPRYNPHTPKQWSSKVSYIMEQIANY